MRLPDLPRYPHACAPPIRFFAVALLFALTVATSAPPFLSSTPTKGTPEATTPYVLVGWNNLGMHCMDADFAVFSVLPPYNTVAAQLKDRNGNLVKNPAGITVTYQAVADPDGSINTTSQGKTNFWDHILALFGVSLPVDVGLAGNDMPGTANVPQNMAFEPSFSWFVAYGIPITPYDDAGHKNPYPLVRLVAKNSSGAVIATTDVVAPVSDEMDCSVCHSSGSGPAAQPSAGWVYNANFQRDFRLNILRLHDDRNSGNPAYAAALATAGFNSAGLYTSAVTDSKAVQCSKCHASEALPGSGLSGIPALTASMHGLHAWVTDPTNGLILDSSANRSACYRCHPGSETKCLRGAMGNSVASDGSLAIQCQSCHGHMSAVGSATRTGWLDEPNCQNCHTGTAAQNNGQIRYTNVYDTNGQRRQAVNATFATDPDTPAAGFSLYRFSDGHGGLQCESCHGSTHAEYPSSHRNDNIQNNSIQGHSGTIAECSACHNTVPSTVSGGPHGMHPVGQAWVAEHHDHASAACKACHGNDYRGTVLSAAYTTRTLSAFGTKNLWRGFQVGCYTCHNGPSSDDANPNHAPVANSKSASTPGGTPVNIPLTATDADGNALVLRIISQPSHGTTALSGTQAKYYPDAGYVGSDSFTFAARDGSTDSNLATVSLSVTGSGCSLTCNATAPSSGAPGDFLSFSGSASLSNCPGATTYAWDFGDGGRAYSQNPGHAYAAAGSYIWSMTASAGGKTCAKTGTIVIGTPPTCSLTCSASASPSSGVAPLAVSFSASATPSNCSGTPSFSWTFGDGTSSSQQNPSHTYSSAGTYTWSMTASVAGVSCSKTGSVTVSAPPVCALSCTASASPSSGVAPLAVSFTASATPSNCSGTPSFSWTFGDGESSNQKNPSHTYAAEGTYTWSLTASVDGVSCSKTGSVTVTAPPCSVTCSASASPSSGVSPLPVSFSAAAEPQHCSGNPSFSWSFGDGSVSVEQNPAHTYATAGTYTWSMTASAGGVTCSKTGSVTVSVPPCSLACTASASPLSGEAPLAVTFAATAGPLNCSGTPSFSWTFGDGASSTEQNPSHTYSSPGTYVWTLTASVDGVSCSQAGSVEVKAKPKPPQLEVGKATTAPGSLVKVPLTLTANGASLCSLSTDITFDLAALEFSQAEAGPAATAAEKEVSSSLVSPGLLRLAVLGFNANPLGDGIVAYVTFRVTGTASGSTALNHACAGSDCAANGVSMTCPSGSITIEAPPPGSSPGDCDGDGSVSIGEVQNAVNMFLGIIPPSCGVDCNGDGVVSVGELQKVLNAFLGIPSSCGNSDLSVTCAASPASGAAPLSVSFTSTPSGGTGSFIYDWDFGDGSAHSSEQNPSHSFAAGNFTAVVTVTSGGATATCSKAISVSSPDLSVTCAASSASGVAPLSVSFTSTPSGGTGSFTYDWDFGDGSAHSTLQNPSHSYAAGNFIAVVTVTSGGATASCSKAIVVSSPALSVACTASPASGAAPLSVSFTATPSGGTGSYAYDWNFGDGSAHSTLQNPSHSYAAGNFTAVVTVTSGGATATCSKAIAVSSPALSVACTASPASGTAPLAVSFTSTPSGGTGSYAYDWNFGDGSAHSTLQNPSHSYAAGNFTAVVTVTSGGATATCSKAVSASNPALSVTCAASPASGTAPLAVSFTSTPSGGTGSYTYDWNFGDGSAHSTVQNPSHSYAAAGSFTAVVTVTSGGATATCSKAIAVSSPALSVACTASPASGTAPLAVSFTSTPSGGTGSYTYDWNFGDGSAHSTLQNPSHSYAAGNFTAVVTVTSGGATATCSKAIAVSSPALSVACTASPASGTAPLSVSFTSTPSGGTGSYTYDWNFGDGSAHSTLQNPSHSYAAGNFTAVVTVTSGGATATCSKAISVTAGGAPTLSSLQSSIFTPRCAGCHGNSSPAAGCNLTAGQTYSNTVNVAATTQSGIRVVPGSPSTSVLVSMVSGGMGGLTATQKQQINDWISAGALNN